MDENTQKLLITSSKIKDGRKCERSDILYEEVIEKNFQIIGDLLKKLNTILARHEEFESDMMNMTKRINKMETDMESIHNEHRRDNLHIFSDIENLKLDLRGIDNHINFLREETKKKSFEALMNIQKANKEPEMSSQAGKYSETDSNNQSKSNKNSSNFGHMKLNKYQSQTSSFQSSEFESEKSKIQTLKSSEKISEGSLSEDSNENNNQTHEPFVRISRRKNGTLRKSMDDKIEKKNSRFASRNSNFASYLKGIKTEQQYTENSEENKECEEENDEFHEKVKESEEKETKEQMKNSKAASSPWLKEKGNKENQKIYSCEKSSSELVEMLLMRESKIENIETILNNLSVKSSTVEKEIVDLGFKIDDAIHKCSYFVNNKKLSEEIFTIMKEISKVREASHESFANKLETRKALAFMENKLRNTLGIPELQNIEGTFGTIVSKCLSCNKLVSNESRIKQKEVHDQNVERKKSLKELKKKTIEILSKDKVRHFSKFEACS